jgi:hypothetical protein
MKPRFKYVNLKRFSNETFGYDNNLKLVRMDTLTYRKLFRKSRIFTASDNGGTASYYAYNERPGYYQLIFAGNGHYVSDLVLFHFAPDGKLLAEQVVACSFFDAGQGELTKSFIRHDSLLIRAELIFGERPAGVPCDSLVTVFKIARAAPLPRFPKKGSIPGAGKQGCRMGPSTYPGCHFTRGNVLLLPFAVQMMRRRRPGRNNVWPAAGVPKRVHSVEIFS